MKIYNSKYLNFILEMYVIGNRKLFFLYLNLLLRNGK